MFLTTFVDIGFNGVTKTKWGFVARLAQKNLGTFSSAEEAALALARARQPSSVEKADRLVEATRLAIAAAESERLVLRDGSNRSGFRYVEENHGGFFGKVVGKKSKSCPTAPPRASSTARA